ncbi:Methyl farnesoate epoxidase [Amphibalanus amphitrite]|uniref:Methyl farnesoate epoxidase n=2 Tax=Amphibalanus amphitrite TaxID=1232801 RepID=A0A6A4WDB6_AMPAM|nr:Methyl farnesoate epoxidase [Amphibalanus amphitrite]
METIVLEEFEQLAKEMERDMHSPMKVNQRFNVTVLNVLWRLVANKRLDHGDPEAQKRVTEVNDFVTVVGPSNPLIVAPSLRFIAPEWSGFSALKRHRDSSLAMFQGLMQEHRQTLDRAAPRDFIDRFLIEMESPDAAARSFTDESLSIICMDLFLAGMETTSTSLTWALLLLVMHPDVQTRVQQEIDAVLGVGADRRLPSYSDRANMPYTEATLQEVSRRATVLPRAVGHAALVDAPLGGYTVAKGSLVLMHLDAVHMDPSYWGDPDNFRPERFINADGTFRRDERVIPFGVGKRFCLGETLARMEMFMLFTCLLQRFRFSAAPGQKLSLESRVAAVQQPMEFLVNIEVRG